MTTDRATAESLTARHASRDAALDHPHPSAAEAKERGHMRRSLDESKQRKVWLAFYVSMAVLLVVGVTLGLGQNPNTGEALPPPPVTR